MKSDKRTGQLAAPSQRWKGSYQLGIKQRDLEVYDRITTCKINQSSGATFVLILQDFHAPSIEWPWWTMNDHQWPQINYTMRWSPLASHLAWYAAHAVLTLWLVLYQWLPFSWLLSNCWVWRTFVTLWFELEDWQTLQRAPTFAGKPIKGINFGQFAALQKETWRPMIKLKKTRNNQPTNQPIKQPSPATLVSLLSPRFACSKYRMTTKDHQRPWTIIHDQTWSISLTSHLLSHTIN
jgi:hypothetical protein